MTRRTSRIATRLAGFAAVLGLAALLSMPTASAAEPVGRVMAVAGGVTAERPGESARGLARRDPIYAGDIVETGRGGQTQIRFRDGGMVDLEPDSRFRVDRYGEDESGAAGAVMSFLRGALRTITGSIGSGNDDTYRMETPVATIGVRGTAYALHYCDADCADEGGEAGLYGRVDDGRIVADGPGGRAVFNAGEYFFIPDSGVPRRIVVPPEDLLAGGDGGDGGGGDDVEDVDIEPLEEVEEDGDGIGDEGEGDLLDPDFEAGDNTDLESRPGTAGNVLFGGAFFDGDESIDGALFASPDGGEVRLEDGSVVGAEFPGTGFVDASKGELVNTGTTTVGAFPPGSSFDIHWGRWTGEQELEEDGDDSDGSDEGGFVYAYTDIANLTPSTALAARTMNAFYDRVPGPPALDTSGDLWSVDSLTLTLDFDANNAFLNNFDLSNVDSGAMLGLDTTAMGLIDNATSSLTINGLSLGGGTYSGTMVGKFVGNNGQALIIRFDLSSGSNTIEGISIVRPAS